MAIRWRKGEAGTDFTFLGSQSLCTVTAVMRLKDAALWEETMSLH